MAFSDIIKKNKQRIPLSERIKQQELLKTPASYRPEPVGEVPSRLGGVQQETSPVYKPPVDMTKGKLGGYQEETSGISSRLQRLQEEREKRQATYDTRKQLEPVITPPQRPVSPREQRSVDRLGSIGELGSVREQSALKQQFEARETQASKERVGSARDELKAIKSELEPLQRLRTEQMTPEQLAKRTELTKRQSELIGTSAPFAVGAFEGALPGSMDILQANTERAGVTPDQTVLQQAERERGFGTGKLVGTTGRQLATYALVSPALRGTSIGAKLLGGAGASAGRQIVGQQAVDLLIDTVVQTPSEYFNSVKNETGISGFAKDFAINRGLDILFNVAIGGITGDFKKARQALDTTEARGAMRVVGLDPAETLKTLDSGNQAEIRKVFDHLEQTQPTTFKQAAQAEVPTRELTQVGTTTTPFGEVPKYTKTDVLPESAPRTPMSQRIKEVETKQFAEGGAPVTTANLDADMSVFDGFGDIKIPFVAIDDQIETAARTLKQIEPEIPKLKDLGTTERWTTDVYRNFEKVFGKEFDKVKQTVLDPFDSAKKLRVEDEIRLTNSLKKDIVDDLGIKKGSKESALVMRYGEKRISYDELVADVGKDKADKIVKADDWFRKQYDELIDDINATRSNLEKEAIPKRADYYRHYTEIGNTFEGFKNLFESNKLISPQLEGISEFTRPTERWASFKQKRTGGAKFKEDAVGGFLDYVRAGTYAKHIDPQVKAFRDFRKQLANTTENSKNINNFIGYLDEFANNLAGKTNKFDRTVQDLIGRKAFSALNMINARVKSNAVLGNMSSALSQIANVPQGVAFVKNPKHLAGGVDGLMKSILGGGDKALYEQSGFLKERLTDSFSKFDTKILDQPKKAAAWTLGALDEVGTKFIWSSAYRKGLAEGVDDAVKYADDVARKLVAGRGIGETPILQQAKTFQMVAPFTLEVNNLWKVQKDFLKKKDFAALAMLYVSNWGLNKAMEEIRGSGVVFDPIQAIIDGYERGDGLGDKILSVGGSLGGEVLGNLPLGSSLGSVYPEYGTSVGGYELPTRKEIFGEQDPTRYGTSVPIVKALQDPVKNFLLPWGGGQLSKTLEGLKTTGVIPRLEDGELSNLPVSQSATGRIRTAVEPSLENKLKSALFGQYSTKEMQDYFDRKGTPYSEKQTEAIKTLVNEGVNLGTLDNALTTIKIEELTKKNEKLKVLIDALGKQQANKAYNELWGKKPDKEEESDSGSGK